MMAASLITIWSNLQNILLYFHFGRGPWKDSSIIFQDTSQWSTLDQRPALTHAFGHAFDTTYFLKLNNFISVYVYNNNNLFSYTVIFSWLLVRTFAFNTLTNWF